MKQLRKVVLLLLLSFTGVNSLRAQLFTDDIASVDMSAGAIYLPMYGEKNIQPSISVNATIAGNLYLGASAIKFTDAVFNAGYHVINSERAMFTLGYERFDFFEDQLKAQGLFAQLQVFSESDFTFFRVKSSYILNASESWAPPVTVQLEIGVRFDTGVGGFGRGYSRGSESWFPI